MLIYTLEKPEIPEVPEGTQDVVEGTIDVLSVVVSAAVGFIIGILIGFVIVQIVRMIGRKHVSMRLLARRISKPMMITWAIWGARTGMVWVAQTNASKQAVWFDHLDHAMVIGIILSVTWLVASAIQTVEDMANYHFKDSKDELHRGRIATQTQLLRRLAQVVVIIVGLASVALTFPSARVAMGSLLGAAGVASVVATLAAQTTLGNVFAGLQLAVTDAIRVGDIVLIPGLEASKERGTVEEITLTYVVLQAWDDRRLIVPSSEFTTNKFENWTRRKTELIGTVELYLDFTAPVSEIRAKTDQLLKSTDLWDGKAANVQVTAVDNMTKVVRVMASAKDSGALWDLQCYLRESLIDFINEQAPHSWPRRRIQPMEVEQVTQDLSDEQVADLAEELVLLSGRKLGTGASPDGASDIPDDDNAITTFEQDMSDDPVHQLRLEAAQRRARWERRKQKKARQHDQSADLTTMIPAGDRPHPQGQATTGTPSAPQSFKPTKKRVRREPIQYRYHDADTLAFPSGGTADGPNHAPEGDTSSSSPSARLFSGSPEADKRGERLKGPGKDVFDERNERIERQTGEHPVEG